MCREVWHDLTPQSSWLWHPEVVSDKRSFLAFVFPLLLVEKISLSEVGLFVPPVNVNPIDSGCLFLPVDNHTLVNALLIRAEEAEVETGFLVNSFNNFNRVFVNRSHWANRHILVSQVMLECPPRGLRPVEASSEMVFDNCVLIMFKPKTYHFLLIILYKMH